MTETRDFDRLARAWLDLMPDEAPDRVIDTVLQAVDVTPQRRSPFDPAIRRFFPMNRLTSAAVALAIFVLGGGALLLTRFNQSTVGPSQAPTLTPAPSPTPAAGAVVPSELRGKWFGGTRTLARLAPDAGTVLEIAGTTYKVVQSNQQDTALLGGAASILDGRIQARIGNGPNLCQASQVGSYAYSLSPSGETLTVLDPQDPCAIRQSTLVGTWWRIDCKAGQDTCLGQMDAGTYSSQYWIPTLGAGQSDWAPRFGGVTFTVPDGWANFADWPNWLGLGRAADYATLGEGDWTPDYILLMNNAMAESQDRPCSNNPASGIGTTPTAIANFLRGLSTLSVTKPAAVTIGGHPGLVMDIVVTKAPKTSCQVVEFLLSQPWRRGPDVKEVTTEGFGVGVKERLILVETGTGPTTAIVIHAGDTRRFDSFAADAMPIVESMQFK